MRVFHACTELRVHFVGDGHHLDDGHFLELSQQRSTLHGSNQLVVRQVRTPQQLPNSPTRALTAASPLSYSHRGRGRTQPSRPSGVATVTAVRSARRCPAAERIGHLRGSYQHFSSPVGPTIAHTTKCTVLWPTVAQENGLRNRQRVQNCGARLRFLVLDQNGRGVHHFATICRPSGVSRAVAFLLGSWAPTAVPRERALLVRPRVRSLLLRTHCDECVSHEHRACKRRHEDVSKKGGSQKLVTRSSNITSPRQPDTHCAQFSHADCVSRGFVAR